MNSAVRGFVESRLLELPLAQQSRQAADHMEKILSHVVNHGPSTADEIHQGSQSKNPRSTLKHIKTLRKWGWLAHAGDKYHLTSQGHEAHAAMRRSGSSY
jgi:predicted transcriptional regulator